MGSIGDSAPRAEGSSMARYHVRQGAEGPSRSLAHVGVVSEGSPTCDRFRKAARFALETIWFRLPEAAAAEPMFGPSIASIDRHRSRVRWKT